VLAICRRGCAASEKTRRLREESSMLNGLRVSGASGAYGSTPRNSSAASAPFTSADLEPYMGDRRLHSTHGDQPASDDDFDNGLDHDHRVISPREGLGREVHNNRRQGRSRSRESHRSRRNRSRESHRSRNSQRSHRSTRSHRNRRNPRGRHQRGGTNRGLGEPLLSNHTNPVSMVCGDPADTAIDWASTPGLMQHPVMSSTMPHSETRVHQHQHQRHGQQRQPPLASPHGHRDSPVGGSLPSGVGFRSAPGLLSS